MNRSFHHTLIALLAITGCSSLWHTRRFKKVASSDVVASVQQRAEADGFTVVHAASTVRLRRGPGGGSTCDETTRPRGLVNALLGMHEPPRPITHTETLAIVRWHPDGAGGVVEISGHNAECIEMLLPFGTSYEPKPSVSEDRVRFELAFTAGAIHRPGQGFATTIDGMLLGGGRVLGTGGLARESWRRTLAVMGGIGGTGGAWGGAFRAEALLSLGWQRSVTPAPDVVIGLGSRWRIDAAIGAFAGTVKGLDATLMLHAEPYGGIYARVGRDLDGTRTVGFGLRFDNRLSFYVLGGALVGALVFGLTQADWSDFRFCPGGCEDGA